MSDALQWQCHVAVHTGLSWSILTLCDNVTLAQCAVYSCLRPRQPPDAAPAARPPTNSQPEMADKEKVRPAGSKKRNQLK